MSASAMYLGAGLAAMAGTAYLFTKVAGDSDWTL